MADLGSIAKSGEGATTGATRAAGSGTLLTPLSSLVIVLAQVPPATNPLIGVELQASESSVVLTGE